MFATRQFWFIRRTTQNLETIILVAVSFIMLGAGFLPWLKDPPGTHYTGWEIPIDFGGQFHLPLVNYGLLCTLSAVYTLLVAFAKRYPFKGSDYFTGKYITAGLLCLMPIILFLLQFLFIDVQAIARLALYETQARLIEHHFGYSISQQRIPIDPFSLDIATLQGRFVLLTDQVSLGLLLPCLSSWILIDHRRLFHMLPRSTNSKAARLNFRLIVIALLVLVVVFGYAFTPMFCEYKAREELAAGNNLAALNWLNTARFFDPELDQVAYYHIERGQALYFLYPNQQSDDSALYLANSYNQQGDRLDAYQQLLPFWQARNTPPWIVAEMSVTFEDLAEANRPLKIQPVASIASDEKALLWLQLLIQIDPSNVYGHYMVGRIQYDLHNDKASLIEMAKVIQLSQTADIQSSAYTYMGLSAAGIGDYVASRTLLLDAVELDPNYYNNTAREELSGLH